MEDAEPARPTDAPGRPEDMPLRVAIGLPPVPVRNGSRKAARQAAIDAMRMWESALQPRTRDRVFVTEVDVRNFLGLAEQPPR